MMRGHHDHLSSRGSGLDRTKPEVEIAFLFTSAGMPRQDVDCIVGQEQLVRSVVYILSREVVAHEADRLVSKQAFPLHDLYAVSGALLLGVCCISTQRPQERCLADSTIAGTSTHESRIYESIV